MSSYILIGILIAIGSGAAIGAQSIFVTMLGQAENALRVGFYMHLTGALVGAGMVVLFASQLSQRLPEPTAVLSTERIWLYALIAGGFGMLIVPGVAIALPRLGLVVGQASIIMGQISISLLSDTLGWSGGEPVPMDGRRIIGLLVLAVAIYLLLPQRAAEA